MLTSPRFDNFQAMKRIVLGLALASAMLATASCCSVPELAGKWNILTVNGEEATVIGEEKPFMEFNTEDSRIHGFTGCNIMNGAYTQDGKNLTFGNMATTMMAGPEENMKTESAVLDAIGKVASVKADGENILLLDEDKNVILELGK